MSDVQSNCQQYHNEDEPITTRTEANQPKSLTNIYYDCLERIFDFLPISSLLNVAGTNKRLQIAAAAKFGDDFDDGTVSTHSFLPNILAYSDRIKVPNSYSLQFLHCFGGKISKLLVDYSYTTDLQHDQLDRNINQYCADTLASLQFKGKRSFSHELFLKPFKNTESVIIYKGRVRNQLPNFVNWFPNLRHLVIRGDVLIDENASIGVHFPHLEHLCIDLIDDLIIKTEKVSKLLRANPQLQSLNLEMRRTIKMTMNELLDMLSEITKLFTDVLNIKHVSVCEWNRFVSKYPLMEELVCYRTEVSADVAITLIRRLNSLKAFGFVIQDQMEYDCFLNQLDEKWQHHVVPDNYNHEDDVNRIVKAPPPHEQYLTFNASDIVKTYVYVTCSQ